jgi:hypothetical protein
VNLPQLTVPEVNFHRALVEYFCADGFISYSERNQLMRSIERHLRRLTVCPTRASWENRGMALRALRSHRRHRPHLYPCSDCGHFHISTGKDDG